MDDAADFLAQRGKCGKGLDGAGIALGRELAQVVFNDLRNNGLFKPTGPASLPSPSYPEITAPSWGTWTSRGSEMLVHGYVRAGTDGRLTVGCYLYDVSLNKELARAGWVVPPVDWRRATALHRGTPPPWRYR